MWENLPIPAIIAHRGDRVNAPENTIPAFLSALEKGAHGIEFDVKLCLDGHVIVIHDQTLDRTTFSSGNVAKLSLSRLRQVDASKQFPDIYINIPIPTLDEVFDAVGDRLLMNIELTNYFTPGDNLVEEVVKLVKSHHLKERILFSSFLPMNLMKAKRLLPEVPGALLTRSGILGTWGRLAGWQRKEYEALNPNRKDTTRALVERVHQAGKKVYVWSVNEEDEVRKFAAWYVDGIITDDPESAVRWLGMN